MLKVLNNIETPLYVFKHIKGWAKDAHLSKYKLEVGHTSYTQMITYLQKQLQVNLCKSATILIKVSNDNFPANVAVSVKQILMSFSDSQELY